MIVAAVIVLAIIAGGWVLLRKRPERPRPSVPDPNVASALERHREQVMAERRKP